MSSSNKRLAVNTIILYAKLIITTVISLISSRLVLEVLGESDFGLYNVVGGIVTMLNILGCTMVATSYRYITVELGKGENGNPNRVYNTIFTIHIVLAFLLLLVGESVGVYYVNNYLNVEPGKIGDALFVLRFSLLSTAFMVLSIPTNGLIIAREKFFFTSVVEIISAILKILLIVLLFYIDEFKLRYYAVFIAFVGLIPPVSYYVYCFIHDRCILRFKFNKEKSDYVGVVKFAWWMLLGALAVIGGVQGAAMIINLFFGTILNAAFGLATQVYNAISQFTTTLRQAAVPQIMKSHSAGDQSHSLSLVYHISRYSYLCLLIIAVPLINNIQGILQIWLNVPPRYTDIFIVLMLINGLLANLGAGFDATIQATGKVAKNQIGYSIINLSLLPIIYILYSLGMPPYVNVIAMIGLTIITLLFQCYIMKGLVSFDVKYYFKTSLYPSLLSTICAFVPVQILTLLFENLFLNIVLSGFWTLFVIYVCGLNKREKDIVTSLVKVKIFKRLTK